jgi:sulfur-carrier protein
MRVQLLYFAWVKEAVGVDGEMLDLPDSLITLQDLVAWLSERYPVFADPMRLRGAIDQVMAKFDAPIAGAKEIAFFPPVTGG